MHFNANPKAGSDPVAILQMENHAAGSGLGLGEVAGSAGSGRAPKAEGSEASYVVFLDTGEVYQGLSDILSLSLQKLKRAVVLTHSAFSGEVARVRV